MIPSWRRGFNQTMVDAPDVLEVRRKKLGHRGVGLYSLCVWLTSIHKKAWCPRKAGFIQSLG